MAQELWMAFGQPAKPKAVFEGLVADEGHEIPDPVVERFDDGSVLVRAWGVGRDAAVDAWRAAIAELDEPA